MMFMPFQILGIWLRGLLSIAILAGGIYLLARWHDESQVWVPAPTVAPPGEAPPSARVIEDGRRPGSVSIRIDQRAFRFHPGWNLASAFLAGGLALLAWAFAGALIAGGVAKLAAKLAPAGTKPPVAGEVGGDPRSDRTGEVRTIRRHDGTVLRVEFYGPPDAQPIVMTHGWGSDSTAWYYSKRELARRFRVIVWDEPGLGYSKKPDDDDFSMERLAANLGAVIGEVGGRPVVLVGHSIGVMILLTFCKQFPDALGTRVSGLVLANGSYTNPLRTTQQAAICTALEKPVIIPLLHLTIWTWPVVMVMNWMSLLNGSAYRSTKKTSFGGTETPGQVSFVARFLPTARPDVVARGMLGMLAYDATATLAAIPIPALVVTGDKDTTCLPEASAFMAKAIPGGELATLAPARHMGVIEHHGRFDQLVASFADSCDRPAAR